MFIWPKEKSRDSSMSAVKVSVITPVFNAETTIRRCLDSFLAQTLMEWELILVDDGSLDASGAICDEYATMDSRFRVIHQENAGVSAARQAGLEASTGEYVIHADPDDWVESEMLEELYKKAKKDNVDMVISDFYADYGDVSEYRVQRPTSLASRVVLNDMFITIHGSCCNKLVRKTCIERCAARFPEGVDFCEDVCFNVQLLKHPITVSYINKAFYHYVQNPASLTNHYTIESLNAQKRYVDFLKMYLPENSAPVIRSKELVKKMAFRNNILSVSELNDLYPEIRKVHGDSFIVNIMYHIAFTGHHHLANRMRAIYYSYLQRKGIGLG